MSRTITALFDTRADAEAGGERLRQAGVHADYIAVHDRTSHATTGAYSTQQDKGMWARIRNAFLPDADRHAYEEGVRRGGFLLTADVDDDATPAAVEALEAANTIDLDARSEEWRAQGWASPAGDVLDTPVDEAYAWGVRDTGIGGSRFRAYSATRRIEDETF